MNAGIDHQRLCNNVPCPADRHGWWRALVSHRRTDAVFGWVDKGTVLRYTLELLLLFYSYSTVVCRKFTIFAVANLVADNHTENLWHDLKQWGLSV